MTYALEKKVEGEWFRVGNFSKPLDMIKEAFKLGKSELVEDVRVCTYTDPRTWSDKYVENSRMCI